MNMGGAAWLNDTIAVITLVIASYCFGRLVIWGTRRRPTDVDVDVIHGVMGVGMAAMLVPGLSPVPNVTWAWVFAVAAVWLAWRIVTAYRQARTARITQGHYVPHLVMAGAMIYMGVAPASPASSGSPGGGMAMGGSGGGADFPFIALVFAFFMFGYAVWLLDQLSGIATVRTWRAAPELVLAGAGVAAAAVGGGAGPVPAAVSQPPVIRAAAAAHAGAAGELASDGEAAGAGEALDRRVPLSPRLEAGCHIAMAVVMAYMLILMV